MFPYNELQVVMTKLRFKDDTALKTIGLDKLTKVYDAYPLSEGSRKIICLLPKGMNVNVARKLAAPAASQQVIVLIQEQGKPLAKVWPNQAAAEASSSGVSAPALAAGAEMPGDLEFVEE